MIGKGIAARFAARLREVSAEYKAAAQKSDLHTGTSQLAVATTLEVIAALTCEIFEVEA